MSAVILSPTFPIRTTAVGTARAAGRGSLRFTRRGKTVLVLGFLAVAMTLMVVFGGFAAATREAGTSDPVRVVQVESGDTLYDIARKVAAPGEVRAMMQQIKDLNSLESTSLEIGQRLAVPRA